MILKTIPYATQWIDDDDVSAVIKSLSSDWLTQGPKISEFEDKVARYCGSKYAVAVNSGTAALHAACFAAGIGPEDEVITSPITFVASANSILYCGGKPVFADIQKDTINIDPNEVKTKMSSKTKVVIPVHFAGQPCDMEEISSIARANNMVVIEDAAHALGAEYKNSKIGSGKYSDLTILSFHAVKHITTGEGGMILTNSEEYHKKLSMFRTHGITRDLNNGEGDWFYEMRLLGFNYRITDFQCALGIKQLEKLDKFIARRREIAAQYARAFKPFEFLTNPGERDDARSAWHIYPIQVKTKRREIFDALKKSGIGVNVHYIPVYLQPYYQKLGYMKGLCPNAEEYYSRAITLPLYPKMTDEDISYVISKVKEAIAEVNSK